MSYQELKTKLNGLLEKATDKADIDEITASLALVEEASAETDKLVKANAEYARAYKEALLNTAVTKQVSQGGGGDPTPNPEEPDFDKILAKHIKENK